MTYIDFFHSSPVLATFLTLAYMALWGAFIYMFVHMYRK